MAALIGFAALLLTASVQAAEPSPAGHAPPLVNIESDAALEPPRGNVGDVDLGKPAVRRPPDDSELDSNAIVDFPQDI